MSGVGADNVVAVGVWLRFDRVMNDLQQEVALLPARALATLWLSWLVACLVGGAGVGAAASLASPLAVAYTALLLSIAGLPFAVTQSIVIRQIGIPPLYLLS